MGMEFSKIYSFRKGGIIKIMAIISEEELFDRAKFFCEYLLDIPFIFPEVSFFHEDEEAIKGCFLAASDDGMLREDYEDGDYRIEINDNVDDIIDLDDTLIHELIHYRNWYLGYEFDDDADEFIKLTKDLGISNNYERDYSKRIGIYYAFKRDDEKLIRYEKAYQIYKDED